MTVLEAGQTAARNSGPAIAPATGPAAPTRDIGGRGSSKIAAQGECNRWSGESPGPMATRSRR